LRRCDLHLVLSSLVECRRVWLRWLELPELEDQLAADEHGLLNHDAEALFYGWTGPE